MGSPDLIVTSVDDAATAIGVTTGWDVIIVDAPCGWHPDCPGRMQSIATAAHLTIPGRTSVYVHDCQRTVERT